MDSLYARGIVPLLTSSGVNDGFADSILPLSVEEEPVKEGVCCGLPCSHMTRHPDSPWLTIGSCGNCLIFLLTVLYLYRPF